MPKHIWTEEEEDFVREHYKASAKDFLLSKLKGKSWTQVRSKALQLGLSPVLSYQTWTGEEDALLREINKSD